MILGVSEKILRFKGYAPDGYSPNGLAELKDFMAGKAPDGGFSEIELPGLQQIVELPRPTRNIFFSEDAKNLLAREQKYISPTGFERTGFNTVLHVDISLVNNNILDIEQYVTKHSDLANPVFICQGGFWQDGIFHSFGNNGSDKFLTHSEVEKMSKSKYNVVNPRRVD